MRRVTAITLLAAASACQSYVAVPVQPVTLVGVSQRGKVRVATMADILFVVDDSWSMSGKQDRLAAALQDFTQRLDSLQPPVDYQVAIVTTSVSERFGACGPAGDPVAAEKCSSDWGAPGFSCDPGFACFRAMTQAGKLQQPGGVPASILRRRDYTAAQFAQYVAQAIKVGTAGARQPQGFEAMKLAIDQGVRSGFLRDGAKVVVAFFTDAEDCSDPQHRFSALIRTVDDKGNITIVDKCAQESAGTGSGIRSLEPVSTYVQYLRSLKNADGNAKEVEVGAMVSLTDGSTDPGVCSNPTCDGQCDSPAGVAACDQRCAQAPTYQICMADCRATCHAFCGGQVAGRRYLELAYAFSGVAGNICSDDASGPLGRLASVIGIPKEVLLRAPPRSQDLLSVKVDRGGQLLSCEAGTGYQLVTTPDGPAVRFTGACMLQPDDVWDVRYLANK